MSTTAKVRAGERMRFVLWALLGAGGCLALLGALTIGIFVAPVVAVLALVLLKATGADRSIVGAVSGASLILFYVAWLNRDGPGEVCRVDRNVTECGEQWNPWPWVVIGIVLLSVGIAVFYRLGRVPTSPNEGHGGGR